MRNVLGIESYNEHLLDLEMVFHGQFVFQASDTLWPRAQETSGSIVESKRSQKVKGHIQFHRRWSLLVVVQHVLRELVIVNIRSVFRTDRAYPAARNASESLQRNKERRSIGMSKG